MVFIIIILHATTFPTLQKKKSSQKNSLCEKQSSFVVSFLLRIFLLSAKSLYISHTMSNFYGTEIEIWAGFRPVGSTEKKLGLIMRNFWGRFFHVHTRDTSPRQLCIMTSVMSRNMILHVSGCRIGNYNCWPCKYFSQRKDIVWVRGRNLITLASFCLFLTN